MKLTVLVDNNTYIDQYFLGEPALCCLIEDEDRRILLDTGYSGVFSVNAKKMGINLKAVTDLVLSHGHDDHTGGLDTFFKKYEAKRLIGCNGIFDAKRHNGLSIGSPLSQNKLKEYCKLEISDSPVKISSHVTFLGKIPRLTDFENKEPIGQRLKRGVWVDDFLPEDSALALETADGIFLVTGCSHSGICNTVLHAKKLFPNKKIVGLLGGLHLLQLDSRAEKTIEFLEKEQISMLYPCHCTSFAVRAKMSRTLPITEVGVGMTLTWE